MRTSIVFYAARLPELAMIRVFWAAIFVATAIVTVTAAEVPK